MNLNKVKNIFIGIVFLSVIASCKEDTNFKEAIDKDPTVPAMVQNATVENLSGKAKITYEIPSDPKLLYVKAVYTLKTGEVAEVKSSFYNNSLVVEGFADTDEYEIKLYAVSRSEVESKPVSVTIKPLRAPIWDVFNSIEVVDAFGGYNLTAENPNKSQIKILVLKKDEFREYIIDNAKSIYTALEGINSKIRGLDTLQYTLPIVVQDRWGNSTDTLYKVINPIYEAQLPKSKFRTYTLPGDAPQVTNGARLEYMWDDKFGWPNVSFTNQVPGGPDPHIITFDTGTLAKLSRIWIRPFPEGTRFYFLTTLKRFEIYGSANPNTGGALDDSWTLLGSYEVEKPSGLPYGTDSAEDQAIAAAGFNWEVDLSAPKVRYIRVRCLENWAGGTAQSINEITVYGDTRP